jgi:pilus assembly protein Flp/PilA
MVQLIGWVLSWLRVAVANRQGATAIEYALIASLISIVIVTAVALIGTSVGNLFNSVATALE